MFSREHIHKLTQIPWPCCMSYTEQKITVNTCVCLHNEHHTKYMPGYLCLCRDCLPSLCSLKISWSLRSCHQVLYFCHGQPIIMQIFFWHVSVPEKWAAEQNFHLSAGKLFCVTMVTELFNLIWVVGTTRRVKSFWSELFSEWGFIETPNSYEVLGKWTFCVSYDEMGVKSSYELLFKQAPD